MKKVNSIPANSSAATKFSPDYTILRYVKDLFILKEKTKFYHV